MRDPGLGAFHQGRIDAGGEQDGLWIEAEGEQAGKDGPYRAGRSRPHAGEIALPGRASSHRAP